jgi:tRNA1Val (adenine37-N6)-methyltransferase
MANSYFRFKEFTVHQEHCAMKVCTDACLFGAWVTDKYQIQEGCILDIGAGTGLLSLMLAQASKARIDAVELDEAAALQAAENMESSPWHERLQVLQGDIRTIHLGKKYELVVSNPPFFENDLNSPDSKRNLALHSNALSLEELLTAIHQHLLPQGKCAVLLPYHRKEQLLLLAEKFMLYPEEIMDVKQTPRHAFFRVMMILGREKKEAVTKSITIREGDSYTPGFTTLLKPYYLNL